jgi:polar amino acid transport system substrate-binding protein
VRNLLLILWLITGAVCAESEGNKLRIISPDYWCPLSCQVGAEQEGYTIDILRAIFEPRGYQVDFTNTNYSRALKLVRKGLADVIPSTIKAEAPDFVFPQLSIGSNRFCVYARENHNWSYDLPHDLADHKVVVVQSYDYGEQLSVWLDANTQQVDRLTGGDLVGRMIRMVHLGRVDVLIEDEFMVNHYFRQHPHLKLKKVGCESPVYTYIGLTPSNPNSLRTAQIFDEGLLELRKSGELDTIMKSYGLHDWAAN